MNQLELQMSPLLNTLKSRYGAKEIKAEFEAEGSRIGEMMRLKDVTSASRLPIIVKIGGAEAITDIQHALAIGVAGIVAPMVESAFAVSKYINAIRSSIPDDDQSSIEFAINIETITAIENLDRILALPDIDLLGSVTVGRVDLVGSMGLPRDQIDSPEVNRIVTDVFERCQNHGMKTALGGGISSRTLPFIDTLVMRGLLSKFETRKVVFASESIRHGEEAIQCAIEFELLWLKRKQAHYTRISREDSSRIEMLTERLARTVTRGPVRRVA